jgi:hypothetical protein
MNKEQQQIIDKVYADFINSLFYDFLRGLKGYLMHEHLSKEEFIFESKIHPEFSEKWGLKIEERELSLRERAIYAIDELNYLGLLDYGHSQNDDDKILDFLNYHNVPTKLITITYNDKTIESYEN